MKNKKQPPALWAVCFWVAAWQLLAMAVNQPIFFASPLEVVKSLFSLLAGKRFYLSILISTGHVVLGILLATLCAVVLGSLANARRVFAELLSPLMSAVKSVPVVSYVILALICFSSRRISILITFLVVLPVLYANLLTALGEVDRDLMEMARGYEMRGRDRLRYVIVPEVYPIFQTAFRLSCGMAWKAGVAAEVIGASTGSIGERVAQTKLYLETPELFAWTASVLVLSFLTERAGAGLLALLYRWSQTFPRGSRQKKREEKGRKEGKGPRIEVRGLHKSYGDKTVIQGADFSLSPGERIALLAPSGAGKTTLLRILAGFEKPDGGEVKGYSKGQVRLCFQEDRLLPGLDAYANIAVANPGAGEERILALLEKAGLTERMGVPAGSLSGGEKRRVALLRALAGGREILLLDEPFTGLDEKRKADLMALTREESEGRILLLATHSREEARALGAREEDLV